MTSSSQPTTRGMTVLAVDDHPLIRAALGEVLSLMAEPLELLEAAQPEAGLRILRERPDADLVFLDLVFAQHDGLAYVERFRAAAPAAPLMLYTMQEDPSTLRRALELGAAGVVPKTHSRKLLQKAIELVMEGGVYVPPELVRGLPPAAREAPRAAYAPRRSAMSPQQQRILQFLAEGVSNKQIARELGIACSTVKNQLTAVFEKLGVSNRTQAAIAARALHRSVLSDRPVPRS